MARLEATRSSAIITDAYLITCVRHLAEPGDVVAAQSTFGGIVARDAGEELDAFTRRAGEELGQRYMIAVYDGDYPDASWLV